MNYRHAFHAGNFADVLKHVALMLCLDHLKRKETPFRVIDTHAGSGRYRLDRSEAERTGEWLSGIARIYPPAAAAARTRATTLLAPYLAAIRAENPGGDLTVYPGSPALIQSSLRPGDVLVANELQPDAASELRTVLAGDKSCKVTSLDGYAALKALLPPKERRGLVLVDPPFEEPGELVRMTEGLAEAIRRFATGTYLLWYPIKDPKPIARFHRGILDVTGPAGVPPPLRIDLLIRPPRNPLLLNGAGLVAVNPPYTLEADMRAVLPLLAKILGEADRGDFVISPLSHKGKFDSESLAARRPGGAKRQDRK